MKQAIDIALELKEEMPGIGFFNKAKRLQAFIFISNRAEELSGYDTDTAMEALTVLSYVSAAFQKAAITTAENIRHFSVGTLYPSGWSLANVLAIREGLTPHHLFGTK